MKIIRLTQDQTTIVSDEDYGRLSRNKWHAAWDSGTQTFYAQAGLKRKTIKMHRVILGVTNPKIHVDHINHDTLDNRRENLRLVDTRTNSSNQKDKENGKFSSRYTGVSWNQKNRKWFAGIRIDGKRKHLGSFDSEEEASKAYRSALDLHLSHVTLAGTAVTQSIQPR